MPEWLADTEWRIAGPTLVAIIAAAASVISAYFSWHASRRGLARDFLDNQITALTAAVVEINSIDVTLPYVEFSFELGKGANVPLAFLTLVRLASEKCARICATAISAGHFVGVTRQQRLGGMIGDMNLQLTAIHKFKVTSDLRADCAALGSHFESVREYQKSVSLEFQSELDDAVATYRRLTRLKANK